MDIADQDGAWDAPYIDGAWDAPYIAYIFCRSHPIMIVQNNIIHKRVLMNLLETILEQMGSRATRNASF